SSTHGRARTVDLDLDSPVLRTPFLGRIAGNRIALAAPRDIHQRGGYALSDQIVAHRGGAVLGQHVVIGVRADAVGVTGYVDRLQVGALELRHELIELGTRPRFQLRP